MVSIILPTYNEKKNIEELIPLIHKYMKRAEYEIIVVDDNSPDRTSLAASKLAKEGYPISVVTRYKEKGLASATVKGFQVAKYPIIAVMDSDMQHDPKYLPKMIKSLINENIDMVIGSRYLKDSAFDNWSLWRKALSKSGLLLTRPLTKVNDPLTQFYVVKKRIVDEITFIRSGYRISLQILALGKLDKVAEVPIVFYDRKYGKSNINFSGAMKDLSALLQLYLRKISNIRKITYLKLNKA